jgi:hypothetical protein
VVVLESTLDERKVPLRDLQVVRCDWIRTEGQVHVRNNYDGDGVVDRELECASDDRRDHGELCAWRPCNHEKIAIVQVAALALDDVQRRAWVKAVVHRIGLVLKRDREGHLGRRGHVDWILDGWIIGRCEPSRGKSERHVQRSRLVDLHRKPRFEHRNTSADAPNDVYPGSTS